MNYQLTHIFDKSSCLSRRQMRNYISNRMPAEERHAAEHHLNNCSLCAEASEGYIAVNADDPLIDGLNANFLNDHFGKLQPQVHQNSFTPVMSATAKKQKKASPRPVWLNVAVAGVVLAGLAVLIYREKHKTYLVQQQQNMQTAEMPVHNSAEMVTVPDAGTAYTAAPIARHAVYTAAAAVTVNKADNNITAVKANNRNIIVTKTPVASFAKANVPAAVAKAKPLPISNIIPAAPIKKELQPEKVVEAPAVSTPPHTETPIAKYPVEEIKEAHKQSNLQQGDELYSHHNYQAALDKYVADIDAPDYSVRHNAAIKAAKCYSNIGDNEEAKKLLKSVISDGGPDKHNAKKMLRRLKSGQ